MTFSTKFAQAALLAVGFSGAVLADSAETNGGISVKSEDGRFESRIGGRIHFDANVVNEDEGSAFGSSEKPSQGGFYFRRIYLTAVGRAYGWKYKLEGDFANKNDSGATNIAFQDVWIGTGLGPGEIQLGQRKAIRSMEDLTSSNDVLMIERPFASASGGMLMAKTSRFYQNGVFYHASGERFSWGVGVFSLRSLGSAGTEGLGESGRLTYLPFIADRAIVHVGISYSDEHPGTAQDTYADQSLGAGKIVYAGRRGPDFSLGTTTGNLGTLGLEYANVFGPFFAQAEYMLQKQKSDIGPDQDISAYYLQTSYFITGETKPYKQAEGVFGNPKPAGENGAFEITTRFDSAKAKDPGYLGSSCLDPTDTVCEVSAITVGGNYYVNPNVRFMLNYVMGKADKGDSGTDKPYTIAARFQMSW